MNDTPVACQTREPTDPQGDRFPRRWADEVSLVPRPARRRKSLPLEDFAALNDTPPLAFPLGSAVLNDTPVACQTREPTRRETGGTAKP